MTGTKAERELGVSDGNVKEMKGDAAFPLSPLITLFGPAFLSDSRAIDSRKRTTRRTTFNFKISCLFSKKKKASLYKFVSTLISVEGSEALSRSLNDTITNI